MCKSPFSRRGIQKYAFPQSCIGRAGLFAETAEDALGQVDIVTLGAAGAVFAFFRFNVNRHCRTNCLAQFTRDTALFAVRIPPLRVQATETHGLRRFLFGKINCVFAGKKFLSVTPMPFTNSPSRKVFTKLAILCSLKAGISLGIQNRFVQTASRCRLKLISTNSAVKSSTRPKSRCRRSRSESALSSPNA